MWAYQTSVAPSSSLLVKQNWCHAPVPPCTKEQIPIPAAWLMPYYHTVSLSSCSGPSPGFLSTLLRLSWETNALIKAHTDASSWRSWTAGAAWMVCRYPLMLPVVIKTLPKKSKLQKWGTVYYSLLSLFCIQGKTGEWHRDRVTTRSVWD